MTGDKIRNLRKENNLSQAELAKIVGVSDKAVSCWERGEKQPRMGAIEKMVSFFGVTKSFLLTDDELVAPTVTDDIIEFPVIGEVAAGYEHIAAEDWTGETVSIPASFLRGRKREEYFVLTVCGNSMYPLYMDGDKVLILKQSTLNRSGDIGVIRYDGDKASLKKVEYVEGKDWLKMIPINPAYEPKEISGEDIEKCSIIGIPKLLIRDIK